MTKETDLICAVSRQGSNTDTSYFRNCIDYDEKDNFAAFSKGGGIKWAGIDRQGLGGRGSATEVAKCKRKGVRLQVWPWIGEVYCFRYQMMGAWNP